MQENIFSSLLIFKKTNVKNEKNTVKKLLRNFQSTSYRFVQNFILVLKNHRYIKKFTHKIFLDSDKLFL